MAFKTDNKRLEKDSMIALQRFKRTRKAPEGQGMDFWNKFPYTSELGLPNLACDTLVAPAVNFSTKRMMASKRHNIIAKNLNC